MQRGGLWVLAQGVLTLAVIAAGFFWPGERRPIVLTVGAIVFLLAAVVCGGLGAVSLGRNLTPFPRPSEPGRLVRTGIYGLIRHPLYTAVMCGSFGWALLRASWPGLLFAVAMIPFFDAKARREERWLQREFPEYQEYAQRVRRFLPWLY